MNAAEPFDEVPGTSSDEVTPELDSVCMLPDESAVRFPGSNSQKAITSASTDRDAQPTKVNRTSQFLKMDVAIVIFKTPQKWEKGIRQERHKRSQTMAEGRRSAS